MPRAAARIIVTLAVLALVGAIGMAVFAAVSHAQNQPPRLALLIGNQNYATKVGPLKNPRQDVALIEASLKRLGFQVTVLNDADYRAMDVALKRYVRELRGAGAGALGFFYYSGHGAAHAETQINYLIPVDVASAEDDGVWDQSFQQNQIIDLLSKQGSNATQFAVFDACRNELHLSGGAAKAIGGEKGFVPVANAAGLLIAYATAPGRTASDAGEGGGPYAKALAEELLKPGVEAVTMFRNVQIKVKQSIGQDPWLSFPSLAPVYLAGQVAAAAEAPKQQAQSPLGPDAQAWSLVQNSASEAVLEEFTRRFPDSVYAGFAKARLDELKRKPESWWPWSTPSPQPQQAKPPGTQTAVVVPKTPPAPPKPAETQTAISVPTGVSVPTSRPVPPEPACDGLLVSVAAGKKPCIKPGSGKSFRDCPDCPEMVVVPAGSFSMGSPSDEKERYDDEGPQHKVTISKPFAVGKYVVTFDEWDACVSGGGCKGNHSPGDEGWGKGRRPVINVNWDDAQEYVKWLSQKTRTKYRLLSEAEWEYAARAGTRTRYFWGDSLGRNNANCDGCGGEWDNKKTAEVGQFQPNAFGLYDMAGNVWQRTDDCWNGNYNSAPEDGSAMKTGDCSQRVFRGGSWAYSPSGSACGRARQLHLGQRPEQECRVPRGEDLLELFALQRSVAGQNDWRHRGLNGSAEGGNFSWGYLSICPRLRRDSVNVSFRQGSPCLLNGCQ